MFRPRSSAKSIGWVERIETQVARLLFIALVLATPALSLAAQQPGYRGKTVAQWIGQLSDEDHRARWHAAYALGQIGPEAEEAVEPLTEVLADPSEQEYVRGGATWALGRIGPEAAAAVPQLIEVLASQHVSVRRKSPLALGNVGPAAKRAIPTLVKLLDDEDRGVRVNAAAALWKIDRDPRGIRALERAIQQGTGTEPYKAAVALGNLGPDAQAAVPALIEALGHADEDCRRASARALGQIGPAAAPALKQALAAPQEPVRRYAVQALGWIGPSALPALIEALESDNAVTRAGAARELGRFGPEAKESRPALVEAVDDSDPKVRAAAAWALGRIGPTRDGDSQPSDSEGKDR